MSAAKLSKFVVAVLLLALAASLLAWWTFVTPRSVPLVVAKTLNFPPAVVGTILGRRSPGPGGFITASVGNCDFCSTQRHMVTYFTAAVPAYVAIFVPIFLAVGRVRNKAAT